MPLDRVFKRIGRVYKSIRKEFASRDEFDKSHGTETTREVNRWRLRTGRTAFRYQATHPEDFARACQFLPPEAKTYPFFDLGCGKGRVLIMAHEYGFERVVGIELSDLLVKTCQRNLAKLGLTTVTVLEESAVTVTLPDSSVVIFMYNPFKPPVVNAVMERLASHQYPLFLIYLNPEHRDVVKETGRFKAIFDDPDYLLVAELVPAAPPA
jgi:SAM-dependent methyltransferase